MGPSLLACLQTSNKFGLNTEKKNVVEIAA